jgi:hypothetical protein
MSRWSPVMARLTAACLVMLGFALIGLAVDHRVITGAPAWLKPVKFGISAVAYLFTLAFMVRDLPKTRAVRVATSLIAWLIALEVLLISLQAARGTSSHFNIDTVADTAIFSTMGLAIATVWVMSMVLLWVHWRTPATDRAMALALRLGLVLNILGAGVGWTMTQPRPAQIQAIRRGQHPFVAGSHTVGAPDGGPALPLIFWSADHGDLRVPHFFGMHALQLLPLLVLGLRRLRRRRDDGVEQSVIMFASAASAVVFVAALVQALSGHPLLRLQTG